MYLPAQRHGRGVDSLQNLLCSDYNDDEVDRDDHDSAFTVSVEAVIRDRCDEVTPVIMAELKQMLDKHVRHGVHARDLTKEQRTAII